MDKLGIDLGSRFVKLAHMNNGHIEFSKIDTAEFYKNYIKRFDDNIYIDINKLGVDETCHITATGYGRNLMSFHNAEIITEIKAHFRGCLYSTNQQNFILVDIGGQDCKVIYAKNGYIEDFVMNDKCAASTGRFIENACSVLGITIEELALMDKNPAALTTTCAVFCESEIIGLLASGISVEEIGAGVNQSIAKKLLSLLKTFKSDNIFAAGGVAGNKALIGFLSSLAGSEIKVVETPQFNGAIGCFDIKFQN